MGKQAVELYQSVGNLSEQTYTLSALACLYISIGNSLAAVGVAKECVVLQSKNGDASRLAAAECLLGAAQVMRIAVTNGQLKDLRANHSSKFLSCF